MYSQMSHTLSRQGIRRLTALDPFRAFTDTLSPQEGMMRFPRIMLDMRNEDVNKARRRSLLKEQDMKRYGKMGVSRTRFHGIENLVDCEYISISDLGGAIADASAMAQDSAVNIDAFLEQASGRLMRDADLIPIGELISILNHFYIARYMHLGLINKVKNEVLFDLDRVTDMELAVMLNATMSGWNVISPRLVAATAKKAPSLAEPTAVSLILKALLKSPTHLLRRATVKAGIECLIATLISGHREVVPSQLIHVVKDLVNCQTKTKIKLDGVEALAQVTTAVKQTDIDSASKCIWVMSRSADSTSLDGLRGILTDSAPSVIETATASVESVDSINKRNTAVGIAATIIDAAHRLGARDVVEMYSGAITVASARGLRCHHLLELCEVSESLKGAVSLEMKRKESSFGPNQRSKIAS